jgi:glycosyltransferase involved in cell wall biosynthesis
MTRVAIYHPWIHLKGGGEKVILEMLKRSEHDIQVYTHHFNPDNTFQRLSEYEDRINVRRNLSVSGSITRGLRFAFFETLDKLDTDADILLTSVGDIGELVLARNSHKVNLGYCHSLRATHNKKSVLEDKKPWERPIYSLLISTFSVIEKKMWKKLDRVFANSKYTRDRIIDSGLKEEEDVGVLYPGIEMNDMAEKGDYLFYPSRINSTKQQLEAIKVVEELRKDTEIELVLAGAVDTETEYVREVREEVGERDWVSLEENVSDDRMDQLYRESHTVLFLGEKEDWGIIPVEAMSYGKPVVALDEGGPKESVVDGETGFLTTVDDMPAKLKEILQNDEMYMEMSEKSHNRAREFTWERFIEQFDAEVRELGS